MARPVAESKLCFYPIPVDAMDGICKHLSVAIEDRDGVQVLDPCAGEGNAVKQMAGRLGLPYSQVHAVELDPERACAAKANLPGARVLGPASFMSTDISRKSFGLIYLNSPFSNELGGGRREEHVFAMHAAPLLRPGGLLVMVLPINSICGNLAFVDYMDSRFTDIAVYRFPDHCRRYREVTIFATLRPAALPDDMLFKEGCLHRIGWRSGLAHDPARFPRLGDRQPIAWNAGRPSCDLEKNVRTITIKTCWKPARFDKAAYTEEEVFRVLADSELNRLLVDTSVLPPREAPISIGRAHLSMLLGSGELDGAVYYFDDTGREVVALRHVVRGCTSKSTYINEEAGSVKIDVEKNEARIKQVYCQKPSLDLHGFDSYGKLYSWCQSKEGHAEDPNI